MLKVFMLPHPKDAVNDTTNAINQIVLKLQKYLPAYGVEVVDHINEADLIIGHAGQTNGVVAVDVAHCHGLYPTAYADIAVGWHFAANRSVINNLITAKVVTVPSQWVADLVRRDMHIEPKVIGWAIEGDQWPLGTSQGYVLWNKTRDEGVCSTKPLEELAKLAPNHQFVTTFGGGSPNMKTIGRIPWEQMREVVQGAAVYLATTKETFGIGTLEAMASGVPVLGFKHGATPDIVEHGITGFLVEPGDYEGLRVGLDWCMKHREILGKNARAIALTYTWQKVAEQFAAIYKDVYNSIHLPTPKPKVSVVIPCYNYGRFVGETIASLVEQQDIKFEVIVVNDGSTDNSQEIIERQVEATGEVLDINAYHIPNGGVANARNFGISKAKGDYIVCIDADDKLGHPLFLKTLADALDAEPRLGIVFTGLQMMNEAGELGGLSKWPNGYDFDRQVEGHNQVPTCCMFRKVAWERAGGFRPRYTPAEDAGLWLTIGSLGFEAKQVTEAGWFVYRLHDQSLSSTVRTGQKKEPNWRDKAWITDNQRPFASDGKTRFHSWPVRNYDRPKVSIIIPVGPYHMPFLLDAVDSVEGQTERNWELIIINDTGDPIPTSAFPFARIINTTGGVGAAKARNLGIHAATAPLVAFLDADDMFHSRFLELTLRAFSTSGKYVYTDWISQTVDGRIETNECPEYNGQEVFSRTSIHSVNILIPRQVLLDVGGFDENMPSWEDVELFMKLAEQGFCGIRVPQPLVLYRYQTGQLRERGEQMKDTLIQYLRQKYRPYIVEGKAVCSCNNKPKNVGGAITFTADQKASGADQLIRIEYRGALGLHNVIGPATGKNYGRHEQGDPFYIYAGDMMSEPTLFIPIYEVGDTLNATPVPADPSVVY